MNWCSLCVSLNLTYGDHILPWYYWLVGWIQLTMTCTPSAKYWHWIVQCWISFEAILNIMCTVAYLIEQRIGPQLSFQACPTSLSAYDSKSLIWVVIPHLWPLLVSSSTVLPSIKMNSPSIAFCSPPSRLLPPIGKIVPSCWASWHGRLTLDQ